MILSLIAVLSVWARDPVDPDRFGVTQLYGGFKEIALKRADFAASSHRERLKFLDHEKLWIIDDLIVDGHHLARMVSDYNREARAAGRPTYGVNYEVVERWTRKEDELGFWKKMKEHDFVYDRWIDGRVIPLRDLPQVFPRNVRGLIDDAHRSLAWMVRMAGAYKNLKQPFQEFEWARFFRQHIRIDESSDAGWQKAKDEAVRLAHTDAAKHLPGWIGPPQEREPVTYVGRE